TPDPPGTEPPVRTEEAATAGRSTPHRDARSRCVPKRPWAPARANAGPRGRSTPRTTPTNRTTVSRRGPGRAMELLPRTTGHHTRRSKVPPEPGRGGQQCSEDRGRAGSPRARVRGQATTVSATGRWEQPSSSAPHVRPARRTRQGPPENACTRGKPTPGHATRGPR